MLLIITKATVDRNAVISTVFYILCVFVMIMFVFISTQLLSCHV